MKNRNLAVFIILLLVTCGIYGLYWLYVATDDLEKQGQAGGQSAMIILIVSIFLPWVGYLLFGISANDNLNNIKAQRGIEQTDNKVLYIILAIVCPIIVPILVQAEINKLVPAEG